MKRNVFFILIILTVFTNNSLHAQNKHALVIGNGAYTGISTLANPVNDANDMEAALRNLGFTVEKLLNGNRAQMEAAVINLANRLRASPNSYGLFFYAGHGVQSNGENYFIPVNADIPSETLLRDRAVPLQFVLAELESAKNELNMVILDACRNNPYGWARSGTRGLASANSPTGTIVMYATSANSIADDGTGRNGLFTSQLLKNLQTPGLSVIDIFSKTGNDVINASNGRQYPEISIKYFNTAYLSGNIQSAPPETQTSQVSTFIPSPNMVRIEGSFSIKPFYISRYEVTQKEWQEVMGVTLDQHKNKINHSLQLRGVGDNYPMYLVSWLDAIEYCNKLSEKENLTPVYKIINEEVVWDREANGYRLPSEAEWEYACRANTTTLFNTGARINSNTGWYNANSNGSSQPVGQKPPNAFGLYDMHGNVSEWCWETVDDPSGRAREEIYYTSGLSAASVNRGGSWSDNEQNLRSSARRTGAKTLRLADLGFRVTRNAE